MDAMIYSESELKTKRVFELRSILASMNKQIYGNKSALIKRILDHYDSLPVNRQELSMEITKLQDEISELRSAINEEFRHSLLFQSTPKVNKAVHTRQHADIGGTSEQSLGVINHNPMPIRSQDLSKRPTLNPRPKSEKVNFSEPLVHEISPESVFSQRLNHIGNIRNNSKSFALDTQLPSTKAHNNYTHGGFEMYTPEECNYLKITNHKLLHDDQAQAHFQPSYSSRRQFSPSDYSNNNPAFSKNDTEIVPP